MYSYICNLRFHHLKLYRYFNEGRMKKPCKLREKNENNRNIKMIYSREKKIQK